MNTQQEFTQKEIEQRAKENSEMYFAALEDMEEWRYLAEPHLNIDKLERFGARENSFYW